MRVKFNGRIVSLPVAVSVSGRSYVGLLLEVARSAGAREMRLCERCSGCRGCSGCGWRRVTPVASSQLIVVGGCLTRRTRSRVERNLYTVNKCCQSNCQSNNFRIIQRENVHHGRMSSVKNPFTRRRHQSVDEHQQLDEHQPCRISFVHGTWYWYDENFSLKMFSSIVSTAGRAAR